jgi:hypothetical protein
MDMQKIKLMKYLLLLFLFACNNNQKKQIESNEDTTTLNSKEYEKSSESFLHNENMEDSFNAIQGHLDTFFHDAEIEIFDTIIDDYTISSILSGDTGYTIKKSWIDNDTAIDKYPNQKACIILKKNSTIFYENCFTKYSFPSILLEEKNIQNYILVYYRFDRIENDNIIFYTSICIPDTDICYFLDVSISSKDGKMNYIREIEEWEEWDEED